MNKARLLYELWSGFGWNAYDELSVPTGKNKPEFPYITYEVKTDDYGSEVALTASVWTRSSSWSAAEKKADDAVAPMLELAPTISQYYGERHSLTEAGLSDDGVTAFELMLIFARSLAGIGTDTHAVGFGELSDESDFAPLFRLLDEAMKEGGGAAGVVGQHMPEKYQQLMAEYGE